LGLTSSDLYTSYFLYHNYRKCLKNLRTVLLFLSVPSPGFSLIHTSEKYRSVAYKHFFNVPYQDDKFIEDGVEKKIIKKIKKLKKIDVPNGYQGYDKKTYFSLSISPEERSRTHLRENYRNPDQMIWLKKLNDLI